MSLTNRLRGEKEIGVLLQLRRRVAVRVSVHVVCGLRHFANRPQRLLSFSPKSCDLLRTLHKYLGTGSPERVYARAVYPSSREKSRGDDFVHATSLALHNRDTLFNGRTREYTAGRVRCKRDSPLADIRYL